MKRAFRSIVCAGFAICLAGAGFAQTLQDKLTADLIADGYTKITVSRTLLGRVQIVAEDGSREREIIFNPRTGVILRDFYDLEEDDDDDDDFEEGEEEGDEEDFDDFDDDDDDDEEDDDEDEDEDEDDEDEEDDEDDEDE